MESVLGKKKFVTVYALAGIAGNILSCVVNPRTPVREGEWEKQSGKRSCSQGGDIAFLELCIPRA